MQIHELQPIHGTKRRKRVGRGGKKGTYSGKGGKGQTARSGRKLAPIIRELIKRYPKLRGYRAQRIKDTVAVVNLSDLQRHFAGGETITVTTLAEKRMVTATKGMLPRVKILGGGALDKKLTVEGCSVSASAKVAIEKAGGKVAN